MATLVLAAAGSAVGGAMGGSLAGLTTMALGKAVGATLGSALDQRVLGLGAEPVETGKVDRFRVMGSSEGAVLPRVFGRMRVSGQVIWASRFLESVHSQNVGGKGGGQKVREFSYSVSLAIALCEGEVSRIGRIWADGQAIDQSGLTMRLHSGDEDQLPDPLIAAIEGQGNAPAYRGTAYVVLENLDLTPFGSRTPQFNFEVFRRPSAKPNGIPRSPAHDVQGVALVPGTGEYSLATEQVFFNCGKGDNESLNVHNDLGIPDLKASLGHLTAELPNVKSVSLVVSWFGNDLRCDRCVLQPAVEQAEQDGTPMAWVVSGVGRNSAKVVNQIEGRPVFGGTPADASVLQAIRHLKNIGQSVMFYPFILMDILAGNNLVDPWSGATAQPPVPWRGRITLSKAAGLVNSPDKTTAAAKEVAGFFGSASVSDFSVDGATIRYSGPAEWSYRRFILHYAHLCALAGGVDAFCIGSEMRGLTQIRDGASSYPAVRALRKLAADVRTILGTATKIGYAADWSEYFGHQPGDGSGDVNFHLDPLWADSAIDFVGIDNYMPLSDWRNGVDHADAAAGSIYDLDYLTGNVAGGEGYDWYYPDAAARDAQDRVPIQDGAYGEDWIFRYKDIRNWWSSAHVNRSKGVKAAMPTEWQPRSKPIWFTELGCPAVDMGTNQPNVFHDPKSSESFFPYYSNGVRDDFIQYRYLQAMFLFWGSLENNPISDRYAGRMVNMTRAHVWAWDARPWPDFPSRIETWVDGDNYSRGHWLNGRTSNMSLAEVVVEICERSGLQDTDTTLLYASVIGYVVQSVETARQSLQPLMLTYGVDSFAVDGALAFSNRHGRVAAERAAGDCVVTSEQAVVTLARAPLAETADRVTMGYIRADADYQAGAVEAIYSDAAERNASQSSVSIVLSEAQAEAVARRWLSEGRIACDSAAFALPPSDLKLVPGDIVSLRSEGQSDLYRIDRVDEAGSRKISAARVEPATYEAAIYRERPVQIPALASASGVHVEFIDLPLLTGDEVPHAPYVAIAKTPWAGPVAVFSANEDFGYKLNLEVTRPAVVGETLQSLAVAKAGIWMPGSLRVRISSGSLQSRSAEDVLNGANVAALMSETGGLCEVFQFQTAELVASREYVLSNLLRGQAGTDGVMPTVWPKGTSFVLIDGAVAQISLPASARGLDRHYRIGPAMRSYEDPSYVHEVRSFVGVGLRPYRPAHFMAVRNAADGIELKWTRRTRIDGDSWLGIDVPIGEERELYSLRVFDGAKLIREFSPNTTSQVYSSASQVADGAPRRIVFEVAQVSDRFGPGPYERIEFNG